MLSRTGTAGSIRRSTLILGLLTAIAFAGCGGSASAAPSAADGTPTAAPTDAATEPAASDTGAASAEPGQDPLDFSGAATNLENADSYRFNVELQTSSTDSGDTSAGSTVFIGIVVNRPDKAQTLDLIDKDENGDVTDETSYILLPGRAFARSGAEDPWQEIPAAQADMFIQALSAFRPEQLFSLYFAPGAADNTRVGDEQKNGVATTHYKGGEGLGAILSAIAGVSGTWSSDVWISKDGGYLVHSEASVAASADSSGGSFSVIVDITDINSPTNVVKAP
ncbi:MAG: hypothetical protein ABIQ17_03440 [Candidatus Limnocylindrales bacterium]